MNLPREFTASVYVLDISRIYLIYHNKLAKWLPPGGHLEANEAPHEAALRECLEETGLHIEFIQNSSLDFFYPNAKTIPNPWLTLLEYIPPFKEKKAHEHVDFVYLAKPIEKKIEGSERGRWFNEKEINDLSSKEIFEDTKQTINQIFRTVSF
ncbi:MAG: NUDIX hydrolase [Rhabdochlamydiaceae bacterium]